MRPWLWATLVGFGLITATSHARAEGVPSDGVRLSFVRGADAADCISGSALEREVAQRMGRDPFVGPARQWIEGLVELEGGYYSVELFERDALGKTLGNRRLREVAGDCHLLDTAIVLAIALIIDPSLPFVPPPAANPVSAAATPAVTPPAASSPAASRPGSEVPVAIDAAPTGRRTDAAERPAARARKTTGASVTTDAVLVHGVLPGFAIGAEVVADLALDERGRYSARFGALYLPEVSEHASAGRLRYGLTSLELGGCAGAPGRKFTWFTCAALGVGAIHVVVDRPLPLAPGDRLWVALRLEAGLAVRLAAPLWVDARLFDWVAAERWEFRVRSADGPQIAFAQSRGMPGVALGLGLRFD